MPASQAPKVDDFAEYLDGEGVVAEPWEAQNARGVFKSEICAVIFLPNRFLYVPLTIIPAFADKSEGPHTQKTQNFDQHFDPKNVQKQAKSS